jgi:chromosome partitioning protein
MKTRIIALANWKGGSGKTATAVNLSACLADFGKKILIFDLDPQSHTTLSLGILPYNLQNTVYELLLNNKEDFRMFIRSTPYNNLDLIPATKRLINAEIEISNFENNDFILKNILEKVKDDYEYIIFDCPPSLGLLTLNALVAATEVMIPLQTHFLALEGLAQMLEVIKKVNKFQNPGLKITGIIPTLANLKARLTKEVLSEIKKYFGENLIFNPIRMDIKIAESPSHRKPVILYAPKSHGAEDYKILAEQIINMNNEI